MCEIGYYVGSRDCLLVDAFHKAPSDRPSLPWCRVARFGSFYLAACAMDGCCNVTKIGVFCDLEKKKRDLSENFRLLCATWLM
ncbi:hypothetical protein CEXT_660311 [Caerostris extrusa]|uniref:Uncharacterized protein n=1 Tax=Caerostris extrusa TaxID=172846 RepID=A0AAV4XET5_CAEEX|nr:hypothetical protein CEXT_660311 [Caerostris extrusa]